MRGPTDRCVRAIYSSRNTYQPTVNRIAASSNRSPLLRSHQGTLTPLIQPIRFFSASNDASKETSNTTESKTSDLSNVAYSTTNETGATVETPLLHVAEATAAPLSEAISSATNATAAVQKTRPIFPWRHEPIDSLVPRLTAGTPEFLASQHMRMAGWAERIVAAWFLKVPLSTVLWNWNGWKLELAESAAYAFTQGVAGMVSNVYQIPFGSISTTVAMGKDGSAEHSQITFHFPMVKESLSATVSGDTATNAVNETKVDSSSESEPSPDNAHPAFSDATNTTVAPSVSTENSDVANAKTTDPSIDPTETTVAAQSEQSPSKTAPRAVPAPNVTDMLLEPLRKLFESAHQSGCDQLIIKLQTQPISAVWYNLLAIPYVTRLESATNPSKLVRMKTLSSMQPTEAFRTVFSVLDRDLERSGKLESTVELQVVVCCQESFQVLDRATGAVLQGSLDGATQLVSHLVRLETTAIQEIDDNNNTRTYFTDWQITDIDDLLGHKAWYQK